MGFLKFLKKSKEDKLEMPLEGDLDIPPLPVSSKDKLPPMQKLDVEPSSKHKEKDLLEKANLSFPDLEPPKKPEIPEEMPKLPVSKPPEISEEMPKSPEFPRFEEKVKPLPSQKLTPPPHRARHPISQMERATIREEKHVLMHETTPSKPIYLEVENFKEIKRSATLIKNDLRNADEILVKLQDIKENKDKKFNKWQKTMEDIQKKMIFMDKTLFEGD